MSARSFCVSLAASDGLGRLLASVRGDVSSPAGGLVFVSGALTQQVARVADQVRTAWRGIPACIVPGGGVLTERGEIEGASAVSGILWSGGRAMPFAAADATAEGGRDLTNALAEATSTPPGGSRRPTTALVFARSAIGSALRLSTGSPTTTIFGAGTVGGGAIALDPAGTAIGGEAVGLVLHGLAAPLVETSAACRLVTGFQTIDEVSGGMVLGIGGEPALDALAACAAAIRGASGAPSRTASGAGATEGAAPAPVVFLALADATPDGASPDARYVVRPVRGVDPSRRGLLVGDEVRPGMRIAFAVREAAAARSGLEACARVLSQQALGSAPRFALFLTCAGRGQGLYGASDVEARILRQRFGDLPISGMHSAFEIAPWAPGEARVALYSGVLALFRSPS